MGHWKYHALELLPHENPAQLMKKLGEFEYECRAADNFFCAYHSFRYQNKTYLHIGWNSSNRLAHRVLSSFAKTSERDFFSSYHELSHLKSPDLTRIFTQDKDPDYATILWSINK